MKKKHFRITLFKGANDTIVKELAIIAAYSNGQFNEENKVSLIGMEAIFKAEKMRYPSSNERLVSSVIGETKLTIDKMGSGKDDIPECQLEIEEVEIFEMVRDADDLKEVLSHNQN